VDGQRHAPAALPPGKTQYPLYRRLGGPQSRSGRVRKISPPTGIRSPNATAHSQSLYRLSYPRTLLYSNKVKNEWSLTSSLSMTWKETTITLRISVFSLGVMGKLFCNFRKELSPSWNHCCQHLHRSFALKMETTLYFKFC
jgi:hypothetical protein